MVTLSKRIPNAYLRQTSRLRDPLARESMPIDNLYPRSRNNALGILLYHLQGKEGRYKEGSSLCSTNDVGGKARYGRSSLPLRSEHVIG